MTSPDAKHCYDIDHKPFHDQKPPQFDQKPFCDPNNFSNGLLHDSNGTNIAGTSSMGPATSQPHQQQPDSSNGLYSAYSQHQQNAIAASVATNGNPYFYPFNNMPPYSSGQSTPFLYPQQTASSSPESKCFSYEKKAIVFRFWNRTPNEDHRRQRSYHQLEGKEDSKAANYLLQQSTGGIATAIRGDPIFGITRSSRVGEQAGIVANTGNRCYLKIQSREQMFARGRFRFLRSVFCGMLPVSPRNE
jgi:hypothetical protein